LSLTSEVKDTEALSELYGRCEGAGISVHMVENVELRMCHSSGLGGLVGEGRVEPSRAVAEEKTTRRVVIQLASN
jgi:hypothetical protein